MSVVYFKRDCFATEPILFVSVNVSLYIMKVYIPVADIISITVEQSNSYAIVQQHLNILDKIWEDEISSLLESKINLVVVIIGVV